MLISWYPGHMAKAKRMMVENLKNVDIIIEVRDARMPLASANPDIEGFAKPRIIVLNKADLADEAKTQAWLEYFKKSGLRACACTGTQKQDKLLREIDALWEKEGERLRAKGITRLPRALVAGIPNVGKSTIINALSGAKRARTGDKPGVTKGKQWIKTSSVELLDTPGLLWPKLDDQDFARELAFCGAINDDIFDLEDLAFQLIFTLRMLYPEALCNRYGIEYSSSPIEDFDEICRKRGFILRGGNIDYARGARTVCDEFRSGKLGRISLEEP